MVGKKRKNESFGNIKTSSNSIKLSKEELLKLKQAKEILFSLKEKYNLTFNELNKLAEEEKIPVSIFNKRLTPLESITKYLNEEKNLSLHEISSLIGRNEKNIWHTLRSAKEKYPEKLVLTETKLLLPIFIFCNTKLSALEVLVSYLKEKNSLTYHEIAALLERDDRTIWTVYSRARKKNVK